MKKTIDTRITNENLINEDNFQYILIQIIDEVIEKRTEIHKKYHRLVKKVLCCEKSLNKRTYASNLIAARSTGCT